MSFDIYKEWQYTIVVENVDESWEGTTGINIRKKYDLEETLNFHGSLGWELVSVQQMDLGDFKYKLRFIFKRPKQ